MPKRTTFLSIYLANYKLLTLFFNILFPSGPLHALDRVRPFYEERLNDNVTVRAQVYQDQSRLPWWNFVSGVVYLE